MSVDSLKHHLKHLKDVHDRLDKQITEAYNNREADKKVNEMKKKKLHLKDEMAKCEEQIRLGRLTP